MKKIIYDIKDDTYERVGEVIDSEDQRYSSTHVSGGGSYTSVNNGVAYTTNVPVRSTTSHHHYQTIWIKESDGTEESHELYNQDVDFREGHDVALLINKNNRHYERFLNLSTGHYWRLRTRAAKKGVVARFFERIGSVIISLLLTIIPVLNFLMALAGIVDAIRDKADYYIRRTRRRILGGIFSIFVIIAYYPVVPILAGEFKVESPISNDFSITVGPEIQRNIMIGTFYLSTMVGKKIPRASENKSDIDNLSVNAFIKKHKLKERSIDFKFLSENEYRRGNEVTVFSYVWHFLFLTIGSIFMYLMLMDANKSHRKVSKMLDERAKEIQKEYNNKEAKTDVIKNEDNSVSKELVDETVVLNES